MYPELDEEGKYKAEELMKKFNTDLKEYASEIFKKYSQDFYTDIINHIESDSWTNFRVDLLHSICNYKELRKDFRYDARRIRKAIFENFKDEIIEDLNQDLYEENKKLKERELNHF